MGVCDRVDKFSLEIKDKDVPVGWLIEDQDMGQDQSSLRKENPSNQKEEKEKDSRSRGGSNHRSLLREFEVIKVRNAVESDGGNTFSILSHVVSHCVMDESPSFLSFSLREWE